MTETALSSMYIKILLKNALAACNFDFVCPYQPGRYTMTNFTFYDVPKVPFPTEINICANWKFTTKVASRSRFKHFLTVDA